MEASKLLLYIITASFICGTFCLNPNNFDNLTHKPTSKLPRFICNVIKSTKREDSGLKTVAFVTTENKLEHSMIDDVMRCMPMEISTTIVDLRGVGDKVDVKAQLVVMLADRIDGSTQGMSSLLSANHLSKFLIVTSELAKLIPQNLQKLLNSNEIQNFAILSEENGSVAVQRPEIFNGEVKIISRLKMSRLSRQIFPDKLKDLQGYKYKVAIDFSSYGITSRNNRIVQRTSHLFRTIAKSQNASSMIIKTDNYRKSHAPNFDFVIDAKFSFERSATSSILFNRNNFCILFPKVRKLLPRNFVFPQYMDLPSWITIFSINVSLYIVWKLYKNNGAVESPGKIVFGVLCVYHGQSVSFSRKNRLVLTIVLQILIFMSMFIHIMYERIVGLTLANPHTELGMYDSFKIFRMQIDTKIAIDSSLDQIMPLTMSDYLMIKSIDRIILFDEEKFDHSSFDTQKFAFVGHCDFIKVVATPDQHLYLYPVGSVASSTQVNHRPQNPFIERIQTLINYAFEGGLTEFWETMTKMSIFGSNFAKSEAKIEEEFFEILKYKKLVPTFHILYTGLIAGFVAFILEVFYHDFIRNLSWQLVRRWTTSMASRSRQRQNANINWQNVGRIQRAWYFWRQRRNLRVQRINVRTVNV